MRIPGSRDRSPPAFARHDIGDRFTLRNPPRRPAGNRPIEIVAIAGVGSPFRYIAREVLINGELGGDTVEISESELDRFWRPIARPAPPIPDQAFTFAPLAHEFRVEISAKVAGDWLVLLDIPLKFSEPDE